MKLSRCIMFQRCRKRYRTVKPSDVVARGSKIGNNEFAFGPTSHFSRIHERSDTRLESFFVVPNGNCPIRRHKSSALQSRMCMSADGDSAMLPVPSGGNTPKPISHSNGHPPIVRRRRTCIGVRSVRSDQTEPLVAIVSIVL